MGDSDPTRFYIFKDTTSPSILISYAASNRLGILHFSLANETTTTQIDTITTKSKSWKHITFSTGNTIIPIIFRTIHYRISAYKTIITQPSKTIVQKCLKHNTTQALAEDQHPIAHQ